MGWESEHGTEYRPPQDVLDLVKGRKLADESWKNDTCPCFRSPHTRRVALFVEHPDPDRREFATGRFTVYACDAEGYPLDAVYDGDAWPAARLAFRQLETRARLEALPLDQRCDPKCPGWAIFDSDSRGEEIEKCDECSHTRGDDITDDDVALLPEAQAALEKYLNS